MKNSKERMRDLWQERIDGHEHERRGHGTGAWLAENIDDFRSGCEYRIKKDKIAEAAEEYVKNKVNAKRKYEAFKAGWLACEKDRDNNND